MTRLSPGAPGAVSFGSQVYSSLRKRFLDFITNCGPRVSRAESPIEAVFWTWWQAFDLLGAVSYQHVPLLVPQFEIVVDGRKYRLDFALLDERIAIEVDGHDFHERTKDQVAYRNARDCDLQTASWIVFHFSGSQIVREPSKHVLEVIDRAQAIVKLRTGTTAGIHPVELNSAG